MSKDYTQMWKDLGIDLEGHAGLMGVLGGLYRDVYRTQRDRPSGMGYWDFIVSEIHGLRVEELLAAKRQGRKVVGTFCLYVPEELVLAADAICIGLCAGADVGTASAERLLPRNTCALIKSFVGFKLDRLCPYVEAADLVIGETTCDGKTKAYELFAELAPTYVMEVPRMKTAAGRLLWRSEIGRLTARIEELTGRSITTAALRAGVEVANAKRRALARLASLRSADPAPISGLDALLVSQTAFYDDPVRFTGKVEALCDELEERVAKGVGATREGATRLLVSGCPMAVPSWKVPHVIESSGAVIVGEESCIGERGARNLVREDGDTRDQILDRIAERYLAIDCAMFTPNDERAAHVVEMSRRARADGVVQYALQFCTPYTVESHRVGRILGDERIPTLKIETDYSMEDVPQLRTRVQAFLEMLA